MAASVLSLEYILFVLTQVAINASFYTLCPKKTAPY